MRYPDYESVLLKTFGPDVRRYSNDDIKISTATTVRWLSESAYIGRHTTHPEIILDRLAEILEALPSRVAYSRGKPHDSTTPTFPLFVALHDWQFYKNAVPQGSAADALAARSGAMRRVLHALHGLSSTADLRAIMPDGLTIGWRLHSSLEQAHDGIRTCEAAWCPWVGHQCTAPEECHLLYPSSSPLHCTDGRVSRGPSALEETSRGISAGTAPTPVSEISTPNAHAFHDLAAGGSSRAEGTLRSYLSPPYLVVSSPSALPGTLSAIHQAAWSIDDIYGDYLIFTDDPTTPRRRDAEAAERETSSGTLAMTASPREIVVDGSDGTERGDTQSPGT